MIEFKCGQCGAEMEAPDSLAGQTERCPECGFLNRVSPEGRLSIHSVFAGESAIVQRLVQDRPRFWEHSLTVELLKPQISEISKSLDEACAGMRFRKTRIMSLEEYLRWCQSQLGDLTRIMEIMRSVIEDGFLLAWGPPGKPGNAVEIKRAVERFVGAGQALVEWEAERCSVVPPEHVEKAHDLMTGWAKEIFLSFRSMPIEMERLIGVPGDHEIPVRLRCPDFGPFREQLDRILDSGQHILSQEQTPPAPTVIADDPLKVDRQPDTSIPPSGPCGPEISRLTPGFLYVLVNSAMPGLVKVGKTQRDPETRAQELSGVTGIPTPFVVAYHEWFSDCSAAEDFVHAYLEEMGYRLAENREFFSAPVKVAIEAIIQAKARLDKVNGQPAEASEDGTFDAGPEECGGDSEPWSDLLAGAYAALVGEGDTIEDHEQAMRLYKQAARLGSGLACRWIGRLHLGEEFGADEGAAMHWFNEGVQRGDYQCLPELALLYLGRKHKENAAKCWARYLQAVGRSKNDIFFSNCYRYIETAAQAGIVIDETDQFREDREQIIQNREARVRQREQSGKDGAVFERAHLLLVRYRLFPEMPPVRHKGNINYWNSENNSGFITGPDGQDAYLLGYQIVKGALPPRIGQPVAFVPVVGDGKLIACVVSLL